ncbi:hypothetical protein GQF61_17735 [Sphingobacterium sp. DK4209]|uniref:Uncharacterized protein n=1 Tax=Sphingobacterium zhuxiongii TaxID=2662364 RepID=A0A5Q0QBH4_9SPHI|nr:MULTISPECIES: hypothetical protein [unclassified Sphingobacterium]MVZ67684.1 hypothetical protein [Sphingobacterium sp. DK4209]QGA26836.1 hypothetical protein GFH32_11125 [Sphingobacterium sp. dk4302]
MTSVFITLLGIGAFLKLSIAPKKATDIAIAINRQGITGNTTPIARAAGLIEWKDIVDYQIEQGRLLVVLVDPQKYADRMKNFFVRDTFMKGQKGIITISFAETDSTYEEIAKYMIHYVDHNSKVI